MSLKFSLFLIGIVYGWAYGHGQQRWSRGWMVVGASLIVAAVLLSASIGMSAAIWLAGGEAFELETVARPVFILITLLTIVVQRRLTVVDGETGTWWGDSEYDVAAMVGVVTAGITADALGLV